MERDNQTAYLILGMLSVGYNLSGYDIRKAVESSVNYFWGESYGQIYPTLKRLAAQGLIVPVPEPSSSPDGRPRQKYSITAAGHARLRAWLAKPYRDHPLRDEILLKLFFSREAAPGVAIAQVRAFQERTRRLLATLLEIETLAHQPPRENNPHLPFFMLTLSYGVAQIRAALEWSDSALRLLETLEAAHD